MACNFPLKCMYRYMIVGRGILMTNGEVQEGAKEMIECLKILEGELRDKLYNFGGENFEFLDILQFFPITAGSFPTSNQGEIP